MRFVFLGSESTVRISFHGVSKVQKKNRRKGYYILKHSSFSFQRVMSGDIHCHVTGSHEEALYYRHQFHGVNLKCLNGRQKPVISFL